MIHPVVSQTDREQAYLKGACICTYTEERYPSTWIVTHSDDLLLLAY